MKYMGGIVFMYEYKVLTESDYRSLQMKLNNLGNVNWKLVNIAWNNDEALLIATLIKEK